MVFGMPRMRLLASACKFVLYIQYIANGVIASCSGLSTGMYGLCFFQDGKGTDWRKKQVFWRMGRALSPWYMFRNRA